MKRPEDFSNPKKPWGVEGVEWRVVRFLEKVNLIKGVKPKNLLKKRQENTLPYLTTEHFRQGIIKEYVPLDENKITLVQNGDLVIIADGSRSGELFFCDKKGVLVSTMAKFEFDEGEINKKFLFWFLTTHFEHLNKSEYTATPHVNKNHLKNLRIPIPFRNGKPDLETQKKIVEYIEANFTRIDKILEKKKKELKKLDELWESILEQAFKSREGEEWREMRLGDVAEVVGGSTAPQNKKFYENGKYLFVRVSDLGAKKNFTPLMDTKDKLNEEGIKRNKLVLVPENTIVFPKSGAAIHTNSRGILGREAFIVNHLAGVIALKHKSYPRYLLFYLSKLDMGKYISPDSSYPSLKLETIKNLKIPLPFRNGQPDLEKQKEIANYLDGVYEKIKALKEKIQNQITQLEEMEESILDEVFNHDKTK